MTEARSADVPASRSSRFGGTDFASRNARVIVCGLPRRSSLDP
jgi:hypothetical protein